MTDLYRRLLGELTDRFGGTIDDANADAIAYAAAELYHRDFEPRLWEEKSAHDMLDLFGIPRSGVFAPYPLSHRLLLFQRRSSQEQYVTRAHEVLTAMGIPRFDGSGVEQSLKWRLDRVLAAVNGERPEDEPHESGDEPAGSDAAGGAGDPDQDGDEDGADREDDRDTEAFEATAEGENGETGEDGNDGERPEAEARGGEDEDEGEEKTPAEDVSAAVAGAAAEIASEIVADSEAPAGSETAASEPEPEAEVEPEAEAEPEPVQLAEAVKALEQAAEVEANLANAGAAADGPAGVDLMSLTETLGRIQGEIAALRDLVEAFELGVRRQLDDLQTQLARNNHTTAASPSGPAPILSRPADPTREMPPVEVEEPPAGLPSPGEGAGTAHRAGRRTLLVVLLVLLGVLLAGGIATAVAVGWDTIRPKPAGFILPWG